MYVFVTSSNKIIRYVKLRSNGVLVWIDHLAVKNLIIVYFIAKKLFVGHNT